MAETIVVAGALAQKPGQGGHTWVFLNWLLGFRRLGWDVLFLDRLEPEMCRDAAGQSCRFEDSLNLRVFLEVMERFGLSGQFSLDYHGGECVIGVPRREALATVKGSAFF